MNDAERLVVIGGVAAGMSAASAFKRIKPEAEAIVFEKDYFISYGACSLPYYISDDIRDFNNLISLTPEKAEERGITVFLRHEATAIDVKKKEVHVTDLENDTAKVFSYDKLVIATGGLPVRPPLPGAELKNIFTMRSLQDGIEIKKYIDQWNIFDVCVGTHQCTQKNVFGIEKRTMKTVIVGGGSIGMEMSESFRKRGCDVTVIEKMDRVLGNMDTSITDIVEKKLAAEGVKLLKQTTVIGFEGENNELARVVTDKGSYEADLALLVIGVHSNNILAKNAGISLGARNAIATDEYLQTNVNDIFAAGDCAEATHLVTGKKVHIPLGATANKQGRIAGENAAGGRNAFEGIVGTAVNKIFDLEVARTGLSPIEAQQEGLQYFVSTIEGRSRSNSYPEGKPITITFVVEKHTGRLLGTQMVGREGVAHRIDTLAACLYKKMTVREVARLDLAYAPPFATVWDPILIAANVSLKQLQKTV